MKSKSTPYWYLACGLVLLFVTFFFLNDPPPSEVLSPLGSLSALSGSVELKKLSDDNWQAAKDGDALGDFVQVQTHSQSQVTVKLNSGYEFELQAQTRIVLEQWQSEQAPKPILVHVLNGSVKPLVLGQKGLTYLLEKGVMTVPEGQTQPQPLRLLIQAKANTHLKDKSVSEDLESTSTQETAPMPALAGTLANSEIEQMLMGQRVSFEKCQGNALRSGEPTTGDVLLAITFAPKGRVKEVRVLHSNLVSQAMLQCILSVVERVPVRPFSGVEIVRSLPLSFE